MSPDISERTFEEPIECALLRHGPDACLSDATEVRESGQPYGDDTLVGRGGVQRALHLCGNTVVARESRAYDELTVGGATVARSRASSTATSSENRR